MYAVYVQSYSPQDNNVSFSIHGPFNGIAEARGWINMQSFDEETHEFAAVIPLCKP